MKNLDHQTIQQVWQRVQKTPEAVQLPDFAPLLTGLRQESALYAQLFRQTKRTAFQQLFKQVNSHIACVKGMMTLTGQQPQDTPLPQPKQEPTSALLRKAYSNALGRLTEYEKRTSDAAFGPVFHTLAAETRNALRTLTELCGAL